MSRLRLSIFLTTMLSLQLYAQTSNELAAKYKKLAVYEVRPGIMMTASFGDNSQVCEMVLQKNRYPSENRVDLITRQPKFSELVDELAPPVERGAVVREGLPGIVSGNVFQTKRNYENVSIEEVGGFSNPCFLGTAVIIIRWKNRGCVFPKRAEPRNEASSRSTVPK